MKRRTSKPSAGCDILGDVGPSALCALFDCVEGLQFWIKDPKGCYRWVNRGFLLNYALDRREQALGKTDQIFLRATWPTSSVRMTSASCPDGAS